MNPSSSFADRFQELAVSRSPFCVGVDPAKAILKSWGLPIDASGLRAFCDRILDAGHGIVGVYKPQSAFFEQFGPAGMLEMQRFVDGAHRQGALVIIDCKRGDVAHTAEAYGEAMLGPDSPFRGDAMTVTPYLGMHAMTGLFGRAARIGAAVFVVVRSSNPEGADVQGRQSADGRSVAELIADQITSINQGLSASIGPVGAVMGATLHSRERALLQRLRNSLVLAPGIGAQGAGFGELRDLFMGYERQVLPAASRSIVAGGPSVDAVRRAIATNCDAAHELRAAGAAAGSPDGSPVSPPPLAFERTGGVRS